MAKSMLNKYFWFIPTAEIDNDKPTMFKMRTMTKKDHDVYSNATRENNTILMMLDNVDDKSTVPENMKKVIARIKSEQGFSSQIYRNCITEIINAEFETGFVDSITDKEEIVAFIGGLEDEDIGKELDEVLWKESNLEEFEMLNFTLPSGSRCALRTIPDEKKNDPSTVEIADTEQTKPQ